jgi:hypothetical protein
MKKNYIRHLKKMQGQKKKKNIFYNFIDKK